MRTALIAYGWLSFASLAAAAEWDALPPSIQVASVHESQGDWAQALAAYRQALGEGAGQTARTGIHRCLRRAEQSRRLADPLYREYAESLSLSQALSIYGEVLTRVPEMYWSREQSQIERLVSHGLDELAISLPELAPEVRAARSVPASDLAAAKDVIRGLALAGRRLTDGSPGFVALECAAGACAGLDEYTLFLYQGRDSDLSNIGITLRIVDQRLVIDRVSVDSWAQRMGLMSGDRIRRLMDGDDIEEIEVQSTGEPPRTLRLPAPPPAISEADLVQDSERPERSEIGYVRVTHFGRQMPLELDSAILRLRSLGAKVLVLDVRGNPGGILQAAVQAAERFLPRGPIATAIGYSLTQKGFAATGPATCDLPLVLMVDEGTASAAEVFVAALKDNRRATLVGQMTYGKAAVQQRVALDAGGGLQLTIARLFAPSGSSFHGVGIAPHVLEPRTTHILETGLEQAVKLRGAK